MSHGQAGKKFGPVNGNAAHCKIHDYNGRMEWYHFFLRINWVAGPLDQTASGQSMEQLFGEYFLKGYGIVNNQYTKSAHKEPPETVLSILKSFFIVT